MKGAATKVKAPVFCRRARISQIVKRRLMTLREFWLMIARLHND
jgi:hypothetical protein